MSSERDLFVSFERMRREIDGLFGDVAQRAGLGHRRAGFSPPVDVCYGDLPPRVIVSVALPGVRMDEVELQIHGRELMVAGHRHPREASAPRYQQIEIEQGPFGRVIQLGADVVAEEATAVYDNGILHVEIPLARPAQGRRAVQISSRGTQRARRPASG